MKIFATYCFYGSWKFCLVSRLLNPKSVFEARSQWKFSRADIAGSECRQWKVRQTGIWTGRGAAVLSVQKISSIDVIWEEISSDYITADYAIKSSSVLLLVAWWRQPVCHLGLSLEMLGGRVNDQTDNKNCLHIYTKLQEGIYLFFIKLRSWKSASLVLLLNYATFHQKDQLNEFNPRMRKQFGMRNNLEQKIRKKSSPMPLDITDLCFAMRYVRLW